MFERSTGLDIVGRDVAEGAVQPVNVEAVGPSHRRELDVVDHPDRPVGNGLR